MSHSPEAETGRSARSSRFIAAAAVVLLYLALVLPAILSGRVGTGESADQVNYHVPVIRTMAAQWPHVDLKTYDSATTPGYHLLMAWVWQQGDGPTRWAQTPKMPQGAGPSTDYPAVTLSDSERQQWGEFIRALRPLQLVNAVLSLGLVLAVFFGAARFAPPWAAAAITLPLLLNQYVLGAAIWLTTDNVGWLFVALALGAAAMQPGCMTLGRTLLAGLWATLGVLVRQIHLWVVGAVLVAGSFKSKPADGRTISGGSMPVRIATIIAVLGPVAVVAYFFNLWGALVPQSPRIRDVHGHGINPAAIPFALSLCAAYGVFFVGVWKEQLKRLRPRDPLFWLAIGIGVISAIAVATSTQQPTLTDPPQRGYGWLWKLSGMAPTIRERSTLLVAMAPAGAVVLMLMLRAARDAGRTRQALILSIGLLGWLAAQTANPAAWQRYFDPITLIGLGWLAALGTTPAARRAAWIGPVILALFMAGLSFRSIKRDLDKNELPFDGGVLVMRGELNK